MIWALGPLRRMDEQRRARAAHTILLMCVIEIELFLSSKWSGVVIGKFVGMCVCVYAMKLCEIVYWLALTHAVYF